MEAYKLVKVTNIQKKYGRLTVLREYRSKYPGGRTCRRLECICDCGNITNPTKEKVVRGETQSCGCLRKETYKKWADNRKLEHGEAASNQVYEVYRKCAESRNYVFNLSKSEFLDIITSPCIYCGSSLDNELNRYDFNGSFKYTGIDRYDNSVGYTLENSVPCCKICNRIKTNMDVNFVFNHINKMIDNSHLWRINV